MKILITSQKLDELGGSQTFTLTITKELIKQGHIVEYYSTKYGIISKMLDDLGAIKRKRSLVYDLVIVNQNTNQKLIQSLKGRKVQIVHGIVQDETPIHKIEHIAVSQEIATKYNIKKVINQPVDLERFTVETIPSIEKRRVLSLCQGEEAQEIIESICKAQGWSYMQRAKFKNASSTIEQDINQADIVISLGRGVVESLACGRPVVVFDTRSYMGNKGDGALKRGEDILKSQECNFSGRSNNKEIEQDQLTKEMMDAFNHCWLYYGYRKHAEDNHDVSKIVQEIIR